ncbi:hypothetical protein AVJ23_16695 [Pseudoponticoccus marisrubri]|uniref:PAS domain-containing protein n=2 Tax=Pseudoponticoccus marisrubri TaxID=1685382 RepID=A0A0W7WG75_9RHOB|nr:hypothetical protein AVJ23_16695 [Pseudoponticoccus marisrubri]
MLERRNVDGLEWEELRHDLLLRFPGIPPDPPEGVTRLAAAGDPDSALTLVQRDGLLRVTIEASAHGPGHLHHLLQIRTRYDYMQRAMDAAPNPVWQLDERGQLMWSNAAYDQLVEIVGPRAHADGPFDLPALAPGEIRTSRVHLVGPDGKPLWFEVTSRPDRDGWLNFATSIDTLVDAEMAQRNFVQTLTKTFAHLPIGLAVFNRDRLLVLFNPALVDLTNLPVDFLSAKPDLFTFFDHMRENRLMPEPKNYASWREKLADVISAAREDRYNETWTLPSGLTYRITGRPHPDGAVAFLMEDISAEISLTRHFRSELEMTQSVIDCFDDSVAVFSRLGVLTFSNAAYRTRWDCDPDSAFAEITIIDATRDWQQECEASPIWAEIRDFVLTLRERSAWDAVVTTRTGERLRCTVEPMPGAATMVRFTRMDTVHAVRTEALAAPS